MEKKSFLEKALVKAEKAYKATPEYKAKEEAAKDYDEACDALFATPEWKDFEKAYEAVEKTSMIRELKEAK